MNNTHSQTPIHLSPLLVPKLSIILDQELNEESISVDVSTACEMEMNCWEEEVRKRSRVIYKGDDELSMEGKQSEVSTSIGEIELPGKRKSSFGDPPSSPIPQKLRLLSVSPSTIMLQRVIPASKLPKNKNQRTLIYPPRSSSLFTTPGRGTLAMHKRTPKKCSTKGMFDLNNVVISSHSKCKIQTKDWSSQQNILTPGYKILPFDYYWLGKSQEDGSLDLSPRVLVGLYITIYG